MIEAWPDCSLSQRYEMGDKLETDWEMWKGRTFVKYTSKVIPLTLSPSLLCFLQAANISPTTELAVWLPISAEVEARLEPGEQSLWRQSG